MAATDPMSRSGDPLWTAALNTHRRWLRTAVLARLGDAHAADEVMQEVALAAVRQRAAFGSVDEAAAWLYRVAVRQALLYRRGQGRRMRRQQAYAQRRQRYESSNGEYDPLRWMLADEAAALVQAAAARLPRRDREILMLKYTENWSCRELAARLGISASAVETRLYRARQRLRAELGHMNIGEQES